MGRYIAHLGGAGSEGTSAGSGGLDPTTISSVGSSSNGGNCDRSGAGSSGVGGGGGGGEGPSAVGGSMSSSSGWQGLGGTDSSSDHAASQGPGLGVFTQWSSNGTGVVGAAEAGRQGLWGGMSGAGYPSSSLWGSPALEDRHQMGSPASLLPGDLLGGGADSI